MNHDASLILGRTRSGTLRLSQDETGLAFECDLPDTQAARDLAVSIERSDIDQCSFGMFVDDQEWENAPDGTWLRTIKAASLYDVSPTTFPAYPATNVAMRSVMFPDGSPVPEKRDAFCECDCPECVDGDCEDCSNEDCDDPNCECQNRAVRDLLMRARIAASE